MLCIPSETALTNADQLPRVNTAWADATASLTDALLFVATAIAVEQRLGASKNRSLPSRRGL